MNEPTRLGYIGTLSQESRSNMKSIWTIVLWFLVGAMGCANEVPDSIAGYGTRCLLMNKSPIPPTDDDPHDGVKDIYICNVEAADLLDAGQKPRYPYPEGSLIIKESIRTHQDFVWLIATAEKKNGSWEWHEYTRNFESEPLLEAAAGEGVCIDCHKKVEAQDFIYQVYQP